MRIGKNTSQPAACSGLQLLEKMLAFLRSVSNFFDTLEIPGDDIVSRDLKAIS